jgi:alkylation response protein AidB-like acyl-CoA dehydrogenase
VPGQRGLTTALIPSGSGVRVGEPLDTIGLRSARLAPVAFDVRLDAAALLGRRGAGMAVFQAAMTFERALILAFRLGAMQRQLEEAIGFVRRRTIGGEPISRHQAVSHRLARMKKRIATSRLLVYQAAWLLDRGERAHTEAAIAKWHLAEAAVKSSLDAIALRGGAGYLETAGLGDTLDDALGGSIHSGTSEVLANIVAGWLGL